MSKSYQKNSFKKDFKENKMIYFLFLPVIIFFVIFSYIPMFGIVMAFQEFSVTKGFLGSTWVGFDNFSRLFTGETFSLVLRNTFMMAFLNITIGFVFPIFLALLLSQVRIKWFSRSAQIITYIPYFCATVVVCALVREFLNENGAITQFLTIFGAPKENLLANPDYFWWINTFTDLWQGAGYGAIVFVAAISNINPDLHEAAAIDGAGRWRRLTHIVMPTIAPLIMIMFTLKVGLVFVTGFDKVILLYMPKTYEKADVLTSYVYRNSFGSSYADYSLSAAAGLFQSVIATILLIVSNKLNKFATKSSLF